MAESLTSKDKQLCDLAGWLHPPSCVCDYRRTKNSQSKDIEARRYVLKVGHSDDAGLGGEGWIIRMSDNFSSCEPAQKWVKTEDYEALRQHFEISARKAVMGDIYPYLEYYDEDHTHRWVDGTEPLRPGELEQLRRIDRAARAYINDAIDHIPVSIRTTAFNRLCNALFDDGIPASGEHGPTLKTNLIQYLRVCIDLVERKGDYGLAYVSPVMLRQVIELLDTAANPWDPSTSPETLVIYVLNSAPGETPEDKAYNCIAEGYLEVKGLPNDWMNNDWMDLVKCKFRIISRTPNYLEIHGDEEWEFTIKGSPSDIAEYKAILAKIE